MAAFIRGFPILALIDAGGTNQQTATNMPWLKDLAEGIVEVSTDGKLAFVYCNALTRFVHVVPGIRQGSVSGYGKDRHMDELEGYGICVPRDWLEQSDVVSLEGLILKGHRHHE